MTQPGNQRQEFPPPSPAVLRDVRWLTVAIWGALLLALVVSSAYGIKTFTEGSIASRYIGIPLNGPETNQRLAAVAGSAASVAAALLLFAAWRAFAIATNTLINALATSSDANDDIPAASEWMAESASGPLVSMAGEVVRFLGPAWAVMVVTPAVIGLVTAFA